MASAVRPAAARRTAAAISGARLVILPGMGHYLPAAVYPQVADEVRALADRAATVADREQGPAMGDDDRVVVHVDDPRPKG